METKMIGIILSSSVLAAIITSYITIKVKNTDLKAKHIVEERKDWRSVIRTKAVEFADEIDPRKKEKIMHEIQLRLNPNSKPDNKIIKAMENLRDNNTRNETEKFMKQIAELLKEDWERAKVEVKTGVGNFYKCVYLAFMTLTYNFFLKNIVENIFGKITFKINSIKLTDCINLQVSSYLKTSSYSETLCVSTQPITVIINIILLFFMLMYMFKFIKNIVKNNSDKLNKIIQKIIESEKIIGRLTVGLIVGLAGGIIGGTVERIITGTVITGVIIGVIIGAGKRPIPRTRTIFKIIIFIGLTIGWFMIYTADICQYMNTNDIIRINCSISISVLFFALINVFKDISTEHWYRK